MAGRATRTPTPSPVVGTRAAWLMAGLAFGLVAFGGYSWLDEIGGERNLARFAALVVVPALVVLAFVVSRARDPRLLLIAVALLDVEGVLLGTIQTGTAYCVVVPLVGVALVTSLLPSERLLLPYVAAWLASTAGMSVFLWQTPSAGATWLDVPTFAIVDSAVLFLLWRINDRRSRALAAVAEAEARFRDLFESIELFAVTQDREGRLTFFNPHAAKLTGRHRDAVIGTSWFDVFVPPDRRAESRERYRLAMEGQPIYAPSRESEIVDAAGGRRQIRWSHAILHDANGEIAGLAGLGEDVTATRAAEEAARRAAELMSTLVVSSPLPAAIFDLDLTIQLWNPAAAELFGWPEADVVGRHIPDLVDPADRMTIGRAVVRAIRGQGLRGAQVRLRRRDGVALACRLYGGALRDGQGRTIAVAIQVVDVTAQQAMEEKLREAQKMEAVGRLAGGVAHDFNNSLTAIGGFAALIATAANDPEIREDAETIMAAVRRAGNLTRELLAYSRRSLLQPETIEVNSLVGAVRPMLRRLLGEDVQVVIESGVAEAFVRADPGQLEQAMLNLAVNARDAMPGGGRLTIGTGRRVDGTGEGTGDGTGDGHFVVISIADNGSGIPAELQAQVFDPFFTTKPVGTGTGLGLAMVQGFVGQSGGRVGLRSELGRGTTVEILLPEVGAPAGCAAAPPETVTAAGGGRTILYVEDEPAVAAAGFQILSRRGYRVLLADSGESGVALLRAHSGPIALLLTDVILPDLRGPQLAELARSLHPEAAVLFASGYSADAISRRGELPPGVDLIEKPYAPDQLLARVAAAIEQRHRTGGAGHVGREAAAP